MTDVSRWKGKIENLQMELQLAWKWLNNYCVLTECSMPYYYRTNHKNASDILNEQNNEEIISTTIIHEQQIEQYQRSTISNLMANNTQNLQMLKTKGFSSVIHFINSLRQDIHTFNNIIHTSKQEEQKFLHKITIVRNYLDEVTVGQLIKRPQTKHIITNNPTEKNVNNMTVEENLLRRDVKIFSSQCEFKKNTKSNSCFVSSLEKINATLTTGGKKCRGQSVAVYPTTTLPHLSHDVYDSEIVQFEKDKPYDKNQTDPTSLTLLSQSGGTMNVLMKYMGLKQRKNITMDYRKIISIETPIIIL